MKINRYKKANKHLNFFVVNYGFHKPFQLLIDGTFCHAALNNRVQIKEEIPKYLGGDVKMLITQCVVLETEKLGHKAKGTMVIAKSFGVHRCSHNKNPVTGSKCLLSMVANNQNRYIVATQDTSLQAELLNIPGVPLLYFNRTSIVLKSPSEISMKVANDNKQIAVDLTEHQRCVLTSLKRKTFGQMQDDITDCILPKHAKGPNPLSCKKKKKVESSTDKLKTSNVKQKHKRKRIKVAKHVKEELRLRNITD